MKNEKGTPFRIWRGKTFPFLCFPNVCPGLSARKYRWSAGQCAAEKPDITAVPRILPMPPDISCSFICSRKGCRFSCVPAFRNRYCSSFCCAYRIRNRRNPEFRSSFCSAFRISWNAGIRKNLCGKENFRRSLSERFHRSLSFCDPRNK